MCGRHRSSTSPVTPGSSSRAGPGLDALDRLQAVEEIRALKARYFRCIDTKDWAGFRALFAADATMDMSDAQAGPDAGVTQGPDAISDYVAGVMARMDSVHHGHMPEIEVLSDAAATGIWAMDDELRWTSRNGTARRMHGWGHYHETYSKVDGRWLISTTRLTRLRVELD